MSKIKKFSLMCIISIIILILSSSTCVYANDIAVYLGENRDGWFCVQKLRDPANGIVEESIPYIYRSDSGNEFERAFAYILKSAYVSEINPGLPTNDFCIGKYPKEWGPAHGFSGFQVIAGKHQYCLWRLLYEYSLNGKITAPFNDDIQAYLEVNKDAFSDINADNTNVFSKESAEKIYNNAITTAKNTPDTEKNADIRIDRFRMDADTNIGSLKITDLVGSVQNIRIYWADNTNEQISTNTQGTNFQIYSNKECTETKAISSIREGDIIYVKNNKNSDIINMEIDVYKGYQVKFKLYKSTVGQNAIHAEVEDLKITKRIEVSYGKLTVKKEDYDYNIPLNNAQFAIYYKGSKDSGWIGYNEATSQITYGKTWNEKYIFETGKDFGNGKGYCGDTKVDGEFTIRKLRDGTYTVFEVGTPNGYDLNGQPGYINLKDYGADGNYAILNGYDSYSRGYTSVKVGSSDYSFSQNQNEISYSGDYGWNSNNSYTSDKLIYTVKNKKSTKLVINKKDKNTNLSIKNVGIKILVQTLEKTQYKDASYAAGSWLWLKQDKTLTSNLNEAYEFKTDNNGKIELSNVPYGKYYIYETTPGEGYVLSEQEGYKESKPDAQIGNFFNSLTEYVFLGSKTINKKEYIPEIKDGIYTFRSKLKVDNKNLVLDVPNGSLKSLTSIQTYTPNNFLPQMFMIKYVGNGYYTIRSLCSDKYFDVANGIIGPGARIWQYDKNETDAQLWRFSKNSDDSYCITSKLDNRYCLDIPGGENKSGLPMQMYLRNNSDAQKFDLIKEDKQKNQESLMNIKEGNYKINLNYSPDDLKLAVDIANASNDKANVWLHRSNNTDAQKFTITYIGDGYYIIRNTYSKKIIMTTTDKATNRNNIIQDLFCIDGIRDNYNKQSGYKWKFENNSGKYYTITSKLNDETTKKYVIDADGGKEAIDKNLQNLKTGDTNINLQLYENNDSIAQQFLLESIDSEKTTNTGEPEATIEVTNTRVRGTITIRKFDGTYKKDLQVNDDLLLKGAEFKIYSSTKQKWVKKESNEEITYSNYNDSGVFSTNNDGQIKIENLDYGTYYIFETKSPAGYNLKEQEGYHKTQSGSNDIPSEEDWVALGNCTLESSNKNIVLDKSNSRYVSLSGRVWVDRPDTKENHYDNVYKNGTNDILLQGITVNLIDNRTNNVIATTNASGTDRNGEYKFTQKTDGSKLTYWELAYCHVEFSYNDKIYTLATPFVGSDLQINSKAQLEDVKEKDLYDENLEGNGKVITYKGPTSGLSLDSIKTNALGDVSQRLLTGFYNTSNYTIENINLGLIEKVNAEHSVNEEIEHVKIVRGNYTFTYKYGEDAVIDEESKVTQSAIAFQNSARTFTQKVYPSDIKYNLAKEANEPEYKMYVVYKISVKNNTTHNLPDIYTEQALHLTSLTNQFDTSRYELNKDDLGDEAINSEINRWNISSNSSSTAEYDISGSNKAFKTGIKPNSIESTYIQFKVTQDSLTNLLTKSADELESIFRIAPTVAKASGYHIYTRKDKNWKNNDTYTHRTVNQDAQDGELFIKWKLASERTISGTVFEDTKVNQLEGEEENSRINERIGNGHFEEDNEKTISDVIVTLMNADTNGVAKLYNGELTEENGKWKAIRQDAVIKVNGDGKYSLPGMIPGRYYLKFTYGNGKTEYTDLNGNKIEINTKINGESNSINSNLYKSTILTGNAKNATATNEKSWFIEDIGKNNSVATDRVSVIQDRQNVENKNVELNYSTSQQNTIIDAESPIMYVQFEYVENPEIAHNEADKLNSNCTGMSFGIIERPHVNIELTKTIENVKLTLQNGTTMINGNPEDKNVASNLSKIDDANVKLELDVSYLYGSNAEVTYSLSAQNKSELDYSTEQYYKYGLIEELDSPVTTTVTKVVDYISNSNVGYDEQSDNIEIINLNSESKEKYFTEEAINGNKEYKQSILKIGEELMPEAANSGKSSTDDYTLTVNNLLSTADGILGWESYSEIIGISNITKTPQYICHSGNYIARDRATSEADNADATISIYSSTGENKNLIIYFMVGTGLLVISVGIFVIKKFVI